MLSKSYNLPFRSQGFGPDSGGDNFNSICHVDLNWVGLIGGFLILVLVVEQKMVTE
jgi:hypothetical protein